MNLVFASGFSFPQQLGPIKYFDGVAARFAQHKAVFPPVPPFGSSKDRARKLADFIHAQFPQGPIHIIAHSMGGLDSRILIKANLNGLSDKGRIVTLTTLSTPHNGSPAADLLLGSFFTRFINSSVIQALGAIGFADTGALEDLTKDGASRIPDVTASHPHISYHSYAATGRASGAPTSAAFLPTHTYIQNKTGQANDGLVALESANYGEFQGSWSCDHADIVGHDLDAGLTGFIPVHLAGYDKIVSGLEARIKP
jgi:triacylglycerol lipase